MPTPRYGVAVVAGPDGLIYAIGGTQACCSGLGTVEAYNPETSTWMSRAPLPHGGYGLSAVTVGSLIYAIGGFSRGNTVESYDPTTDTWTELAQMPTGRSGFAAVVGPDKKIYAIGGITDGCCRDVSTVEVYDPATNVWATAGLSPLPTARAGVGGSLGPDGLIYVIGGNVYIPPFQLLNTVEAYSPLGNKWVTRRPMPTARQNLAQATALDGTIYAAGGQTQISPDIETNIVQAYDPSKDEWSTAAPMPTPRASFGMATGKDGRIYAIGGYDTNNAALATVEAFSPSTTGLPSAITAILPDTGGNAGVVTVAITGVGLPAGSKVELAGHSDIEATSVTYVNSSYLTATFDLTRAAPGSYDVIVAPPNASSITLSQGFTVEQGGAPDIWVDFVGLPRLRAGSQQTYYLVVGNRGTIDSDFANVWMGLPTVLISSTGTLMPLDVIKGADINILFFEIEHTIPAGGTLTFPIELAAPDDPKYAHDKLSVSIWSFQ